MEVEEEFFKFPFTDCGVKVTKKVMKFYMDWYGYWASDMADMLVNSYPEVQTRSMLKTFEESTPDSWDIRRLLLGCPKYRTRALLEKAIDDMDQHNFLEIFEKCPEYRKVWVIKEFMDLCPYDETIAKAKKVLPEALHKHLETA